MNESDLKEKGFVKLPSGEWGKPSAAKASLGDKGIGPHTSPEKLNVLHRGQEKTRVEKKVCPAFHVAITIRYSDLRVRDMDASLSTILDCLIAVRRQLESYPGNNPESGQGGQG